MPDRKTVKRACAKALSGRYAIAVVDIMMLRLNGIEMLKVIRSHSSRDPCGRTNDGPAAADRGMDRQSGHACGMTDCADAHDTFRTAPR